jgi:hypothetical protein
MSVTYTWEFGSFEKAPSENGLADVVKVIHWRLYAKEDQYTVSVYGAVNLDPPNQDNFVAYEDITKQWAIDAVSSKLDIAALELSLAGEIERHRNPPIVSAPPPFTN